jgi:uncharacterized protein YegP (UPF0339 family)
MFTPTFTIYRYVDGRYYFRLHNYSGVLLLTGESFTSRFSCLKNIALIREFADADDYYHRIHMDDGYHFYMLTPCGRILSEGRKFSSSKAREETIVYLKRNSRQAVIKDLSERVRFFRPVSVIK